ncbi:MAG: TonB-dependent receptor [Pyrinomonadaceae bacterium]|nr:TonB-dependent receptor [Pyrinomonadaceae bacterium]MBP6211731.1 TonB-dependent receptor [Pyrinomonadaceae bacterium]
MKIIILFAALMAAITVFGQNSGVIKGTVTQKGQPVAGARVEVTIHDPAGNKTFTGISGEDGSFTINDLLPGSYMLIAEGEPGKGVAYQSSVIVSAGLEVTLGLVLNMRDYAVFESSFRTIRESVTVSAGASQTIEQVSKTVDVITGQEMRDRADFSLAESLRTIPGFRVQQLGGFGRTATIKTRGLRNQDTALLIDGIRFRDPSAITGDASPFLSDITLTSVSKIEVLRGSGSSLYGTNAIGGTVDLQTPRAPSGTHGQISGAFGGMGLGRFRGNVSHRLANGKFGIGAGVSRTAYTKGIDGQDNASNTNFQSRFDANPFSKTSISGRIFFSDAKVRLNSSPDTLGVLPISNATIIEAIPDVSFRPDVNDPDSFQNSRFFNGQIAVNQVITGKLLLSGHYQGLVTDRINDNGILGVGFQSASTSIFDGSIHTANVRLTWNPVRQNTLTGGYEFEQERFGNEGRTPSGSGNFFTRAGQSSNTLYLQNMLSLFSGDLQLAGGARIQRFGLSRPEFSLANAPYSGLTLNDPPTAYTFDAAASYFVRKSGTKLRAHVGNGYRVPSLYERFGTFYSTFGAPSFIAIGDPFLKPEKTIAFDAGIDQELLSDKLRMSATYFYTRLTETIGYGNVVPSIGTTLRPYGGYENQEGGIARGGEFSATAKPTRSTDIFASYTFTNSDQLSPQVSGSRIIQTLGIPQHQFTLVATQRFKRLWVNFDLLATSDYFAPIFSNATFGTYVYRFGGNRKGDLTAGYTFGFNREKMTLRLFGTVENLFDQEYYENGFRTAGQTGRVGLSFGF